MKGYVEEINVNEQCEKDIGKQKVTNAQQKPREPRLHQKFHNTCLIESSTCIDSGKQGHHASWRGCSMFLKRSKPSTAIAIERPSQIS
ncbi:hypothetical protein CEXT_339711 [Caerostris extrusa]|uniref:Uncharacterized protein n=1 Tax=Caerostris extrusa TaxID=172846 RepID=A0AAV4PTQ0_CAEEX|nr:hypothetical protein CEXT_339711 [Caerostris extrusa]